MASVGKVVVKGERRLYQLKKGIVATGKHDSYKVVGCLGSGGFSAIYTVRQEQFYLAGSVTNEERIAALKEECALKKDGGHSAVIGFAA